MKEKLTIPKIQKMKPAGEKIAMVTCYDATFARLVDQTNIEVVLVGDSLGMVIQGRDTTLPVTVEDVIYHTRAVSRGLTKPLLVADMPFMSYQASPADAIRSAGQLMKRGRAASVKMEGGEEIAEWVTRLTRIGIPVMGHIGLQPQSIHKYGGYKIQGKSPSDARRLLKEAKTLEASGAWSIVLEGIPLEVAQKISQELRIPTIGIASGPYCDGQVLVLYDLLGLDPSFQPRFVKRFAPLGEKVVTALGQYADEVKKGEFPDETHSFHPDLAILKTSKES